MRLLLLLLIALCLLLASGCRPASTPNSRTSAELTPPQRAAAANQLFLNQKTYDPWILTTTDPGSSIPTYTPAYVSAGDYGYLYNSDGTMLRTYKAGAYQNGLLQQGPPTVGSEPAPKIKPLRTITLNMHEGTFTSSPPAFEDEPAPLGNRPPRNWPALWHTSDVIINGDAEAQQVTHANLFYLISSTYPGSDHSIPPMGLSSNVYGGHIFWDADVWMLPAILPQHPEYAKPIIDYRFKRLAQARRNAHAHGFAGAEFPWESADTGAEVAPAEFARERHITAGVAWAAWQYYLWTGDAVFLKREGWPLLRDCADYWTSRITQTPDGTAHINNVLSPDETAGVVNDDAWTNGIVAYTLQAATRAAALVHETANPKWAVAAYIARPFDKALGIPQENANPLTPRFAAKQADALLLIHPLGIGFDNAIAGRMLDFYAPHTIANGPAMTDSIHAIVAAKLGRAAQSLEYFHASYRPFERGPWDAFSEKRTTNNVYFLTGMAGCIQAVLYGFAGLHVVEHGAPGYGMRVAGDNIATLYADPHLPPGWTRLEVQGVRFRGHVVDVAVSAGNNVTVTKRNISVPGV